jgi:ATP-dependent Clp protease adaptor protein ClpS
MAEEVHTTGRVILATVHKELAALRQEQIHNFGADPRIARCSGSMTAVIEPAEG